jgi:hypothetical protein
VSNFPADAVHLLPVPGITTQSLALILRCRFIAPTSNIKNNILLVSATNGDVQRLFIFRNSSIGRDF